MAVNALNLPTDIFAAQDEVYKWETEGPPASWHDAFNRSLQVFSFGYENKNHERESKEILGFVGEVYRMAGYDRNRMKYMFRLYAPKGHHVRDALAAGPPEGYATRGYERRIIPNRPSERMPTPEELARTVDPFGFKRPTAATEARPPPEAERQSPMPRPTAAGLPRPATAGLPRPAAAGLHRPAPAGPFRPATAETLRSSTAQPHRPATTGLPRPAFTRPPPQRSYGTIPEAQPGNYSFRFADVRVRDDPNLPVIIENANGNGNGPVKKDKATQCSGIEEIRRSLGRGTMIREKEERDFFAHVGSRQ